MGSREHAGLTELIVCGALCRLPSIGDGPCARKGHRAAGMRRWVLAVAADGVSQEDLSMGSGRIRVRGLVRLAADARGALARPINEDRLAALRERVADALGMINERVAANTAGLAALPGPSRRAFLYLQGVDWSNVSADRSIPDDEHRPGSIRFMGLRSRFDALLDDLARRATNDRSTEFFDSICETYAFHRDQMRTHGIAPNHLKPESRRIIGWITYFSQRERFDAYVVAVRTAKSIMDGFARSSTRFPGPVLVHFRPMSGLYRVAGRPDGTRVRLPTPMITFDEGAFRSLAEWIFTGIRSREEVIRRTEGAEYDAVRAAIDGNGFAQGASAGAAHDLAVSFARVNREYFEGRMQRPHLKWSDRGTGCRFGYYASADDTVSISCSLDAPDVPAFVVDFVVYHELLHKKHGARWQNGRRSVHTRAFREEERRFTRFAESEAALTRLARRYA